MFTATGVESVLVVLSVTLPLLVPIGVGERKIAKSLNEL
jgi:hypothetical protein